MASQYVDLPLETGSGPAPGVDSFNGRTGIVVSQAGDYAAGLIANTPAGNISATNVQAAINELDSEKQATITGAATTIVSSNLTANRAVISDANGKVAVSNVTGTELGYLSGTTSSVQTQINALNSGKQNADATLTSLAAFNTNGLLTQTAPDTFAGRTITGQSGEITVVNGNGVAGNPVISLTATGVTPGTYTNPVVTVNSKGRISSITSSTAPPFNPDQNIEIKDDFTGSTVTAGSYGFTVTNAGTGASTGIVTAGQDPTLKAIGVAQMNTGTANTGRSIMSTGLSALNTGYSALDARSRLWLQSAGTVVDPFEFTFGFIDNTAATQNHTDGAYFRFLADGVNVNWEIVTAAGGVFTTTTTSAPVLVNNAQIFQVIINKTATLVQFYIDGALVGSHSTNIPQDGQYFGFGWKILKTAGTNSQTARIDWGYLSVNYDEPRG
jgi:hypothetical protein